MQLALIYGTQLGNTEEVAEKIIEQFQADYEFELVDVNDIRAENLNDWEFVICGIPTWDIGQLEYGWSDLYDDLDNVEINTSIAMFGLGDQGGYPETYQDAMGILYKKLIERGANGCIGFTSTSGHSFEKSEAIIDDKFCGLALDEDQQHDLTEIRIEEWVNDIKKHLSSLLNNKKCIHQE
tara:strand:- start:180 stop:722 length:543 start_codon:yes stop_codon:yes gene_type:complete